MIPLWRRSTSRPRHGPRAISSEGERPASPPPPPPLPGELRELLAEGRARLSGMISDKLVWLASFAALGSAEVAMISARPAAVLQVVRGLGLAGAGGLVVTAGRDLRLARDAAARLDAANDLAWGLQGLAGLSFPDWATAQAAALGLGIAGAAAQTGVGLLRIGRGIRDRDGPSLKLGLLDLGGGLLWLGWDLVGLQQPLYVGSYVVLMIAREAYANRTEVAGLMGRLRGRAAGLGEEAAAVLGEAYDDLRRALAGH